MNAARRALVALVMALTASCGASRPPVVAKPMPSAVTSRRAAVLDPALLAAAVGEREGDPYRLGPGDTLLIAVYDHPELSIAPFVPVSSGAQGGRPAGLLIDNDGTIQLPLLGTVRIEGRTTEDVRALLVERLAVYIAEPRVAVQVLFAGNIRYYLLGRFITPGLKYTDRPLGLLEALSLGGSVELERASLRTAYVARRGKKLPVDFRRLVLDGDLTHNIRLKTGDVIVVPDHQNEQAFVFGGAMGSNPRGGPVTFVNGRLSLLQALAGVGFGATDQFKGNLSDVHVIRSEGDRGELFIVDANSILEGNAAPFELFIVDANSILEGNAAPFELAPGDVVYVPASAFASWDQVLDALLPFLQTIAGILQPFVQLKYLSTR